MPPRQRIPRVQGVALFGRVSVPNSNDVHYAMDSHGGRWVRKHIEQCGYEALLGEALSWLLAREIGVRVPDAALEGAGDEAAWLSRVVGDVTHWDRSQVDRITNMDELGRTLALDVILMNEDRHAGNILLQAVDDLHVTAWTIDHDAALVGWPKDYAAAVNEGRLPVQRNLARGLPISALADGARAGAAAAAALPAALVAELVKEACEVAGEPSDDVLCGAIQARVEAAEKLTEQYLVALEVAP